MTSETQLEEGHEGGGVLPRAINRVGRRTCVVMILEYQAQQIEQLHQETQH